MAQCLKKAEVSAFNPNHLNCIVFELKGLNFDTMHWNNFSITVHDCLWEYCAFVFIYSPTLIIS